MARQDANRNAEANAYASAVRAVTPAADAYLCFRPPPVDPSIHGDAVGIGKERPPPSLDVAASVTRAFEDIGLDPDRLFRRIGRERIE